jgi:hypothetical protein
MDLSGERADEHQGLQGLATAHLIEVVACTEIPHLECLRALRARAMRSRGKPWGTERISRLAQTGEGFADISDIKPSQILFDGGKNASLTNEGGVCIWHAATGAQILRFRFPNERVYALRFSPDGARLAAGSETGALQLWDLPRETRTAEELRAVLARLTPQAAALH